MLAILSGLKALTRDQHISHIRVMSDKTTAVKVLRNMGTSHGKDFDDICKLIWGWSIEHNKWLSIHQIPGKINMTADRLFRNK